MRGLRISIGPRLLSAAALSIASSSCSGPPGSGNDRLRATTAQDPEAREILSRCAEALGGPDALEAPETLRKRSRVRLHPEVGAPVDGELLYYLDGSESERMELRLESGSTLVQIRHGSRCREWVDFELSPRDPSREVERRSLYRSLVRRLLDGDPAPAELRGVEASGAVRQFVFQQQIPDGERWRLWIEDGSFLPTRILCSSDEGGVPRIQQDFLFDHRWVGSRRVPFRQVTTADGRKVSEAWVLEYEIGAALDPRLFDLDSLYKQ